MQEDWTPSDGYRMALAPQGPGLVMQDPSVKARADPWGASIMRSRTVSLPIVKLARFRQRYDGAEFGQFFTTGVFGEILYPLSDLNEIWHQILSKTFQ